MTFDGGERLHAALSSFVRGEIAGAPNRDLTVRQLAILTACYSTIHLQTVKGLSDHLKVSRSCVSMAVAVLESHNLLTKTVDSSDRRNVLIGSTLIGRQLVRDLAAQIAVEAA